MGIVLRGLIRRIKKEESVNRAVRLRPEEKHSNCVKINRLYPTDPEVSLL